MLNNEAIEAKPRLTKPELLEFVRAYRTHCRTATADGCIKNIRRVYDVKDCGFNYCADAIREFRKYKTPRGAESRLVVGR